MNIWLFMLGCVLTNNLIFGSLGFCPFMDGATNVKKSAVIGVFTVVCMAFVSAIAGALNLFVLEKLSIGYLYPMALALAIVVVMQIAYLIFKNKADTKAELPMVAVSCLMIGIVVGVGDFGCTLLTAVCTAVGYLIAIVLMAGVRERIEFSKIPACMKGIPISFVTAGLMAIAFMGVTGLN